MDLTNAILVKTFGSTTAADAGASQLRGHGIECVITSDDCGGMYPPLGVIKLLVNPAEADDAKEILQLTATAGESISEAINTTPSMAPTVPPPRVFRFNSGLIVGGILGALVHFSYIKYEQLHEAKYRYDFDNDGVTEEEVVWRNGYATESRYDRNADGRIDLWSYYTNGTSWRAEGDENFDGRVDAWFAHSPRSFYLTAQSDTDFNGLPDVTLTYEHGVLKQADWRPNGTNVVLLRHLYRHGVLQEELRDSNADGRFDWRVQFDAFVTPIATNFYLPMAPATKQ